MRYDPFDDGFEDLFRSFLRPLVAREGSTAQQVRIGKRGNKYVVKAEIPGAKKEASTSPSKVIRCRSPRKLSARMRSRREQSTAYRALLRQAVPELRPRTRGGKETAQARYQDGVLELTLPKKTTKAAHKLTVQ